jgi:phage shock protein A
LDAAFADLETREELDRELAALRARVDERKGSGKPDTAPRRGEVSGAAE